MSHRTRSQCHKREEVAAQAQAAVDQSQEPTGAPIELDPTLHFCLGRPMVQTDSKVKAFRNWLPNSRERHPDLWCQPASDLPWYTLPQHVLHFEGNWLRTAAIRGWELLIRVMSSDQIEGLRSAPRRLAGEMLLHGLLDNHGYGEMCFGFPTSCDPREGMQPPAEVLRVSAELLAELPSFPELFDIFESLNPKQYERLWNGCGEELLIFIPIRVCFERLTWNGAQQWQPPEETPLRKYQRRKIQIANGRTEEAPHA